MPHKLLILVQVLALVTYPAYCAEDMRSVVGAIVAHIQRADYEGNRAALHKLSEELAPLADQAEPGFRVHYWRGFAYWRSAINGFNDEVDAQELERDLRSGIGEFKAALAEDAFFIEAKAGIISCLGYLAFMKRTDESAVRELVAQMLPLVAEVRADAPDNPRVRWVLGPILWYQARQTQSGLAKVFDNYAEGLAHCAERDVTSLEPTWGKAELYMSLAYTYLNSTPPNLRRRKRMPDEPWRSCLTGITRGIFFYRKSWPPTQTRNDDWRKSHRAALRK